jgi:hypothetical protein
LFACRTLVSLKLFQLQNTDYSLIDQLIRASSQSLRVISLHSLETVRGHGQASGGRLLLHALLSCTSLRFLQIGSPLVSFPGKPRKLFKLLSPIPIEILSLDTRLSLAQSIELISILPLLPSLLAINFNHVCPYGALITKFENLPVAFEGPGFLGSADWPPPFEDLSPRTQELYRYSRRYRASSFFLPSPSLPFGLNFVKLIPARAYI